MISETPGISPVRVLMKDGKWLVPPRQRPALARPPREHVDIRTARKVDSVVSAVNSIDGMQSTYRKRGAGYKCN